MAPGTEEDGQPQHAECRGRHPGGCERPGLRPLPLGVQPSHLRSAGQQRQGTPSRAAGSRGSGSGSHGGTAQHPLPPPCGLAGSAGRSWATAMSTLPLTGGPAPGPALGARPSARAGIGQTALLSQLLRVVRAALPCPIVPASPAESSPGVGFTRRGLGISL